VGCNVVGCGIVLCCFKSISTYLNIISHKSATKCAKSKSGFVTPRLVRRNSNNGKKQNKTGANPMYDF
jgi:hypothetical protein